MTCIERLLMSRMFRRYVESVIVFWCPLVLLSEQPAVTMMILEESGEDEDLLGR